MIADLPPQVPNIPPKSAYAVIEPALPNTTICWQNPHSVCRQQPYQPDHFGGYITFSGTTASGASGSIVQGFIPEFTLWDDPSPSLLIRFDYEAHLLEIKTEIR